MRSLALIGVVFLQWTMDTGNAEAQLRTDLSVMIQSFNAPIRILSNHETLFPLDSSYARLLLCHYLVAPAFFL